MKIARGRVVKGAIVSRARFPDGSKLTLICHDDRSPLKLDPDDEAGILEGIREFASGKGMPISRLRAKLRRYR